VEGLQRSLSRAGARVRLFKMRELQMARCEGDFRCWVETPGTCHIEDDGREIARAVHDCDALFLVGPSSFGGYPSELKKGLDRIIGLVLPFFASRGGQTHHAARYSRSPSFLAALWHPSPSEELNRTLQRLVQHNAINFLAPRHAAVLLGPSPEAWGNALDELVSVAQQTGNDVPAEADPALEHRALLETARATQAKTAVAPPLRSVVLVGSARPRATSTSEVLGSALVPRGGEMVHFVTEFVHDGGAAQRCIDDVLASDLFVLASPLYVDSLPYLATRALECIASAAARSANRPRCAAVINCGFPEAEHCTPALRIARSFADEAGFVWAGGLALGGGEIIHGQPLDKVGKVVVRARAALESAAAALQEGEAIPDEAIEELSRPLLPPWLYRVAGEWRWWLDARQNGVSRRQLSARPFDASVGRP